MKKILAGLALATLLSCPAFAQIATPQPNVVLSADGQPVTTVPMNRMVGGPTASFIQDASKVAAPTYTSGGCSTTPAIVGNALSFKFTEGAAGCAGSTLVLGMPTAANNWVCQMHNLTNPTTTYEEQSASSATSVTFTNYTRTTGVVLTWVLSEVLLVQCDAF